MSSRFSSLSIIVTQSHSNSTEFQLLIDGLSQFLFLEYFQQFDFVDKRRAGLDRTGFSITVG